jgi:hypothetical protein
MGENSFGNSIGFSPFTFKIFFARIPHPEGRAGPPAGCENYSLQPAHLPVVKIIHYNRPTCRL